MFFLFRLLFIQWKQLESFHHKPVILHLTRYLCLTNHTTKTILAMGITVIVNPSTINKITFTIYPHS